MRTKFKLCVLIFAVLCIATMFMPNQIFATEVTEVASLTELQEALADETVIGEIKIIDTIKIEESVIIEGNNKTVITEIRKPFEIYTGTVDIKNLTILNTAARGRCIDVRDTDVELTLIGVTLKSTNDSTNNQTINVGGNFEGPATINLKDTTISAGKKGYGIITFNPVKLNINNSDIIGYAALYMKGANDSVGSVGSVVSINNSTLNGENNHNKPEDNSFATIILEDKNIKVDINNSKIIASGEGEATQVLIGEQNLNNSEKQNTVTISGNSTLTAQEGIVGVQYAKILLNEGVTSNIEIPTQILPEGAVSNSEDGKFVVRMPHNVDVNTVENGTVEVDKSFAIVGENVTITATPTKGYKLKALKVYDSKGNEIKIENNLFVMPNDEVTVEAEFSQLVQDIEIPDAVEDAEKVEDVLLESLKQNPNFKDVVENNNVKVEVQVSEDKVQGTEKEEIKEKLEENGLTVGKYFDITIAVINKDTNKTEGTLNELTEMIKFAIDIPEDLPEVVEGFERRYYIIRNHAGQVEYIPVELAKDGKSVSFETDKFSTYALAYADVKITEEDIIIDEGALGGTTESQPEPPKEVSKEETKQEDTNIPNTGDNILLYILLAIIAIVGIIVRKKIKT